ncbi:TIGR00341 family protein [Halomicrobium sp. ZPS1]|uniref:TIGR00341 family protein n=1 Tax=Halomicrobium mukohataei TaxID=57705 RepID=A0A4D6KFS0_9EURY|nr:TIGR00341 family protein [Halomicrobium mukohataei]QFR21870.1 TIGR00341 family protein [Halomicrobium sp. ZPS1]
MRVVRVLTLTDNARHRVTEVLEENELDYVLTEEVDAGTETAAIEFPLPTQTVEHIQTKLRELDIDDELYTVVIEPEAVVSDRLGRGENPYHEVKGLGYQGVARGELVSKASNMVPDQVIYLLMTAISAIVATAGVLLNSLPVLVGAMVIAPLIGPVMATSVATVLDAPRLYTKSVRYQLTGAVVALISAVGFAFLVRYSSIVSDFPEVRTLLEVSSHTAPNFLLIVVALGAGFAGALSLSTSGTMDLVGVMIAAAVMPPIGVIGVGVAWARPAAIVGEVAVVLVNILSMTLASIISLWYLGYHPESMADMRRARSMMLRRLAVLCAAVVALALVLAQVEMGNVQGVPVI